MNWWNSLTDLQRLLASIAAPATLFMVLQFILMLFGFVHFGEADSADGADHGEMNLHDAHGDVGGHDLADGHSHDIFSGHGHDLADGHTHDLPSGHDTEAGHQAVQLHDTAHESTHDHSQHDRDGHDKADALRLFTLRGIIAFLSVGGWMGVVAIDWRLSNILAVILALCVGSLALWFVAWLIRAFVRMQQSGNVKMENAVGRDGDVYLTIPESGRGKVNVIVQDRLCEMEAVTKAGRAIKTGEKIMVLAVASEGVLLVAPKAKENETTPEGKSITG